MTLSIATEGYLPGMTPLTLATEGHLGESTSYGKSNDRYGEGYLTLLRRIKEDDEEIIEFIQILLTKGLI